MLERPVLARFGAGCARVWLPGVANSTRSLYLPGTSGTSGTKCTTGTIGSSRKFTRRVCGPNENFQYQYQSLVAGRCQPYVPLGPTYSIPVGQKKPHTRAQTPSTQQDQQDCTLADCSATASRSRHPREERTHRRAGAHFAFAQSPVG